MLQNLLKIYVTHHQTAILPLYIQFYLPNGNAILFTQFIMFMAALKAWRITCVAHCATQWFPWQTVPQNGSYKWVASTTKSCITQPLSIRLSIHSAIHTWNLHFAAWWIHAIKPRRAQCQLRRPFCLYVTAGCLRAVLSSTRGIFPVACDIRFHSHSKIGWICKHRKMTSRCKPCVAGQSRLICFSIIACRRSGLAYGGFTRPLPGSWPPWIDLPSVISPPLVWWLLL